MPVGYDTLKNSTKEGVQDAVYYQSNQIACTGATSLTCDVVQNAIKVDSACTVAVGTETHVLTGADSLEVLPDFTTFTVTPDSGTTYVWTKGTTRATLSGAE